MPGVDGLAVLRGLRTRPPATRPPVLALTGWIENVFSLEGKPGHEIVAVYEAALADHALQDPGETDLADQRLASKAVWVHLDGAATVYPNGLRGLLGERQR